MGQFLVELYAPHTDSAAVGDCADRARRAAEQLSREGTPVRFLRRILVPEDETCFYLYEAGCSAAARGAAQRAGLWVDRVTEAILSPMTGATAGAMNTPPTVSAGPNATGTEGSAIPLNGSVSDPDGAVSSPLLEQEHHARRSARLALVEAISEPSPRGGASK